MKVRLLNVGVYGWTRHAMEPVFGAFEAQSGSKSLSALVLCENTGESLAMDWRFEQPLWK